MSLSEFVNPESLSLSHPCALLPFDLDGFVDVGSRNREVDLGSFLFSMTKLKA